MRSLSVSPFRRGMYWTLVCIAVIAVGGDALAEGPAPETEYVILVTIDGVRIQELFGGIDPVLLDADKQLSGIQDIGELRNLYMRESAEERRKALMPFFWSTFGAKGLILGNPERGNSVKVTNRFKVSYPGYAELLTGADQPKVASNLPFRMPRSTVFEYLIEEKGWNFSDIAAFCSWKTFNLIVQREPGTFFCNAGYTPVPSEWLTPGMEPLNTLQMEMLTPWNTARYDRVTWGLALEYLKEHQPRLLYVALDEPDDWGHNRRYDRVISSIHAADQALEQLWETAQSLERYRGKTTMIVTTDHGRGLTPENWIDHDRDTPGSEDIWIAILGPDTPPRGEYPHPGEFTAGQLASTLALFFNADYRAHYTLAEPPLDHAFPWE